MAETATAPETEKAASNGQKRTYTRRIKMGKEQVGDPVTFTDEHGVTHTGQLVNQTTGNEITESGQKASTRTMIVQYEDDEGERYAKITQTCIAPDGSKLDWSSIYCTKMKYEQLKSA